MLNSHCRKAINHVQPLGNVFLASHNANETNHAHSQRHISIEDPNIRPFMYWAHKPDDDCIERLFRYYETTNRLAPFYSEDFIEKWAVTVRSVANAEKYAHFALQTTILYIHYFPSLFLYLGISKSQKLGSCFFLQNIQLFNLHVTS